MVIDQSQTGAIAPFAVSTRHTYGMNLRLVSLALISTSLTGCSTYFNPTVGMLTAPQIPEQTKLHMPNLAAVVNDSNAKLTVLEGKRNSSLQTNRALGVTTFGLGLAAAGYGLYGSHAHAMKNLALASGATYVGSSLFAPLGQTEIYHAGIQALSCINDKASRTLYQIDEKIQLLNTTHPLSLGDFSCIPNPARLARQNMAYEKAMATASTAQSSDQSLAGIARSASNNVLQELDKQLIGLTPSPDAILNAAKTLLPGGGGGLTASTGLQASIASVSAEGLRTKSAEITMTAKLPCSDEENSRLDERSSNYQAIANSLIEAMNYMDDLSTACTLSSKTIAPIALSQEEVTVTKDIKFVNIVISGGREPYLLTQQDIPGISVNLIFPKTINIITDAAKLKAGDHNIEIRDSSTVTTPKILKIHVK